MRHSSRREFLQASAVLITAAIAGNSSMPAPEKPLLSFSTLGCPDWPFSKIMDFAVQNTYQGIEVRGIQRQLELDKCSEFSTAQNRKATLKLMKDNGLRFVDLGSSASLHIKEPVEREKNLDQARLFIDLAHELQCPYIRVFPNNLPKGPENSVVMELIIKGLLELGDYAKGSNVTVLIESHGDLIRSEDLEKIMEGAAHPRVGMIWDVVNMWTKTKEPPAYVYARLKKYIRHTHIKDAKITGEAVQYTFLGKGDAPVFEAIDILYKGGYTGYYSFEWEKLWHPEIAAPELAIADYAKVMMEHFKGPLFQK